MFGDHKSGVLNAWRLAHSALVHDVSDNVQSTTLPVTFAKSAMRHDGTNSIFFFILCTYLIFLELVCMLE